jgi:hypothetical protein
MTMNEGYIYRGFGGGSSLLGSLLGFALLQGTGDVCGLEQ